MPRSAHGTPGLSLSGSASLTPGALAAVLLLTGACSMSRPPRADHAEVLLSEAAPRSLECVPEAFPPDLPRIDMVVDSAQLATGVMGLLDTEAGAEETDGFVLLSLAFDEQGLSVRRDIIEFTTPWPLADSIRKLAFAARRHADEADQEWGVRLRIDMAEPLTMQIGRRQFCPPVPRSREMQHAMRSYSPVGVRFRGTMREQTVHMRAFVSELGTISRAHIVRGELSGSSLERELVMYLRQFLFNPATVDGDATGAWIELPLRIRRRA